jgi:peptidyl-prolyl cis-trans isomerase SurA
MNAREGRTRSWARRVVGVDALAVLLLVGNATSHAQQAVEPPITSPVLVDRIVAIVDQEPILLSDLEREVESHEFELQAQGQQLDETAGNVRQQMLDRLVEIKLLVAQAKVDGLVIGDEELEAEVAQAMQSLVDRFGSRAALERELAKAGMRYQDLEARNRELVRNRLYTMRMVQTYVRPKVEVRDDEVRAYYDQNKDQVPSKPETVEIANILVVPQPDAETMGVLQARLGVIRSELAAGKSFEEVAREHSEGPNASRGGMIGSFRRGDLFSPVLEEVAWTLPIGEISEPVNTELGVHLIVVTDRTEQEVTLRQILLRVQIGEAERQAALARANEAVALARAGQDFAALAREYSDDPASREQGGALGSFETSRLNSTFSRAVASLQPGEVSDPVQGAAGYFVLKLLDRKAGEAFTFEEVKDRVRALLFDQKIEEELSVFIDSLRDRFYIEIKA